MKQVILILFVVIAAWSCKDDKKEPLVLVCGSQNIVDVSWLQEKIKQRENSGLAQYTYLQQAEYNGGYMLWFSDCCPMCDMYPTYWDCNGNEIKNPDFTKATNQQVIWKGPGFTCTL